MNFYKQKWFKRLVNFLFGFGAAIVMIGAMSKLAHIEIPPFTASQWIIAGLGMEAVLFFIQGLIPPVADYNWERLYPGLDLPGDAMEGAAAIGGGNGISAKLDNALASANLDGFDAGRLGDNLRKLNDNVEGMNGVADIAASNSEYADRAREAAAALGQVKDSYTNAAASMTSMSNALETTQEYHNQVQEVTKHLAALNNIYELELQDTNMHIKSLNKFYGNLNLAMESMMGTVDEAESYKNNLGKLNNHLDSLNATYSRMLSAMNPTQG